MLEIEDFEARDTAKLNEIRGQDGVTSGKSRCRNNQIVRTDDVAATAEDCQYLCVGSGDFECEIQNRNGRQDSFDKGGAPQAPRLGIGPVDDDEQFRSGNNANEDVTERRPMAEI